jgi:Spy/CpxP family protein refolding chaperone
MKTTSRSLAAVLGVLLLAAVPALAQPPRGPGSDERRHHGPGRPGADRLFEFLGLTEEQREAWTGAHRAHGESLRPTFEKIRDLRQQMHAELESDSPDAATVGGYLISIHELDADIEASRGELDAAIRGILDDEQEEKLEAWKAANPGRRHGPGSFGHGWGGPRR